MRPSEVFCRFKRSQTASKNATTHREREAGNERVVEQLATTLSQKERKTIRERQN